MTMGKFVRFGVLALGIGLFLGLGGTGCSDDAGGNESDVMSKTEGGKGVTPPDAPKNIEDYAKQRYRK